MDVVEIAEGVPGQVTSVRAHVPDIYHDVARQLAFHFQVPHLDHRIDGGRRSIELQRLPVTRVAVLRRRQLIGWDRRLSQGSFLSCGVA